MGQEVEGDSADHVAGNDVGRDGPDPAENRGGHHEAPEPVFTDGLFDEADVDEADDSDETRQTDVEED